MGEKLTILSKKCSKCEEIKNIDQFPRRKVSKDGHRGQCYDCVREYHRVYNERQLERYVEKSKRENTEINIFKTFKCFKCNLIKPFKDFNYSDKEPRGVKYTCKSCQAEYWQEYASRFEELA